METKIKDSVYYLEEELQQTSQAMGLGEYQSNYCRIMPKNEPIARWELTQLNPIVLELFITGRKKQAVATVYASTAWQTWDEDGIGGENGGEEESMDVAIEEAFIACIRQRFL